MRRPCVDSTSCPSSCPLRSFSITLVDSRVAQAATSVRSVRSQSRAVPSRAEPLRCNSRLALVALQQRAGWQPRQLSNTAPLGDISRVAVATMMRSVVRASNGPTMKRFAWFAVPLFPPLSCLCRRSHHAVTSARSLRAWYVHCCSCCSSGRCVAAQQMQEDERVAHKKKRSRQKMAHTIKPKRWTNKLLRSIATYSQSYFQRVIYSTVCLEWLFFSAFLFSSPSFASSAPPQTAFSVCEVSAAALGSDRSAATRVHSLLPASRTHSSALLPLLCRRSQQPPLLLLSPRDDSVRHSHAGIGQQRRPCRPVHQGAGRTAATNGESGRRRHRVRQGTRSDTQQQSQQQSQHAQANATIAVVLTAVACLPPPAACSFDASAALRFVLFRCRPLHCASASRCVCRPSSSSAALSHSSPLVQIALARCQRRASIAL